MKRNIGKLSLAVIVAGMAFSGCSTKDVKVAELQNQLQSKSEQLSQKEQSLNEKTKEINALKQKLSQKQQAVTTPATEVTSTTNAHATVDTSSLTPPNAKAGECYAKVLIPAVYKTKEEQKLLAPKIENISVTPPTFKTVKYRILQKAQSYKYVVKPATYKCVLNKVMVKPEEVSYKVIPATYKKVQEKVMVSPAHKMWKKGTGPITKLNNDTGEIMCLVEVPAKYKTITKTVVDQPARTEKVVKPAVYKYIRARVVDKPATTEKVVIPATYKVITVKELETPAAINKTEKPEKYQTVEKRYLVKPEELKWERILCKTNTSKDTVKRLQEALAEQHYNPGPIDGVYGRQTQKALTKYQIDHKLPSGSITLESLDALGVR